MRAIRSAACSPVGFFFMQRDSFLDIFAVTVSRTEETGGIPLTPVSKDVVNAIMLNVQLLAQMIRGTSQLPYSNVLQNYCIRMAATSRTIQYRLAVALRLSSELNALTGLSADALCNFTTTAAILCACEIIFNIMNETHSALVIALSHPNVHNPQADRRIQISHSTLAILRDSYSNNPYPKDSEISRLRIRTRLSIEQLYTWFSNRRYRDRKAGKVIEEPEWGRAKRRCGQSSISGVDSMEEAGAPLLPLSSAYADDTALIAVAGTSTAAQTSSPFEDTRALAIDELSPLFPVDL